MKRGKKSQFTDEQKQEITTKYDTGTISQATLGKEYGVSQVYISTIVRKVKKVVEVPEVQTAG